MTMKAITLWQPSLCYLAGVVEGDGWLSRLTLGLRVADHDFAVAFALAIEDTFGIEAWPRLDERGYWLVRSGNKSGRFDAIGQARTLSSHESAAPWLRGLFDSEGNVSLLPLSISEHAFGRRVAIYNTDCDLLASAVVHLNLLGIATKPPLAMKVTPGRKGTRPCYELRVSPGMENYARFAERVGSTIGRKREILDKLAGSYQPPGHHARMQARGVVTRRTRRDAGGRY